MSLLEEMISAPTTIQMAGSGARRVADVRPDLSNDWSGSGGVVNI
jgi:hypothetical protein